MILVSVNNNEYIDISFMLENREKYINVLFTKCTEEWDDLLYILWA